MFIQKQYLADDDTEDIKPTPIRLIGRPRKYENAQELQNLIQSYFDSLFEYRKVDKKEPI